MSNSRIKSAIEQLEHIKEWSYKFVEDESCSEYAYEQISHAIHHAIIYLSMYLDEEIKDATTQN